MPVLRVSAICCWRAPVLSERSRPASALSFLHLPARVPLADFATVEHRQLLLQGDVVHEEGRGVLPVGFGEEADVHVASGEEQEVRGHLNPRGLAGPPGVNARKTLPGGEQLAGLISDDSRLLRGMLFRAALRPNSRHI